jgi:hypothetical protein
VGCKKRGLADRALPTHNPFEVFTEVAYMALYIH